MNRKENEEIRYKYSIQGQIIRDNCMTFSDHYNDEYMYCEHPISHEIEEVGQEYERRKKNGR